MAITGIGNSYNMYGSTYASRNNEASKKSEAASTEAKETTASQAKSTGTSANSKVSDYYNYLTKNYDCVKSGSVAISGTYLRQCANDPEKAKELEENLSLFKDIYEQGYNSAKQNAASHGGKLTHYSHTWSIDGNGNITMISSTTVVSENGTKSRKEIREELEERLEKKREEKKKAEEERAEKLEEAKAANKAENHDYDKSGMIVEGKIGAKVDASV